jgi:hypothetical protein
MKKIFAAIVGTALSAMPIASSASNILPCEDRSTVMDIFEQQGTEYRFTVQGPNLFPVQIFENVETGRYIMIRVDDHSDRVCAQGYGDYQRLVQRLRLTSS